MTERERQHRFLVALNFGLVYVLWGSTYLAIRVVVTQGIPPAMMGATRFLTAGSVMLLACVLMGKKIALSRGDLIRVGAIGVLLLTGGNVGVAWAEETVPSGLAALLAAAVPLWVAIVETLILRGERLLKKGIAGLFMGIAGLVVLLWPKLMSPETGGHGVLVGAGILMFAALSWAVGSIVSRRSDLKVDAFSATAWEMLLAGIVNLVISLSLGDQHRVVWTTRGVSALAYLVVAGSWIGFTAYIWLLNHVPTAKVATYAYVNPIVAVFLGWLILHESVDAYTLAGAVVIVASVWLVNTSKVHVPTAKEEPELAACEGAAD
jgi:drug/metabolite transporter (DMT)-like permease